MHTQCVLKIVNFVSLIILGVLKVPLASELAIKRKFACNPALIGQNVHVCSVI